MIIGHSSSSSDDLKASGTDENSDDGLALSSRDDVDDTPLQCHDDDELAAHFGGKSPGSRHGSPGLVGGDSDDSGGQTSQRWIPGEKARGWIGPRFPLNQQAQVLVANVAASIGSLPRTTLMHLAARAKSRASANGVAAWLLGIGERTIDMLMCKLKAHNWEPQEPLPFVHVKQGDAETAASSAPHAGGMSPEDREQKAMTNLVRLAIVNAVEGRSGAEFERDVHRQALAGVDIGDKQRSRHFCREVENIACRVLQELDALDINTPLSGIGIPSDVALSIDPVTLGSAGFGRHETVLMQVLSLVNPRRHHIDTLMASGDVMMLGEHSGAPMAATSLRSLARHPASLGLQALRARCAVIGGDGQVCIGGVDHRHNSSGAAEKLWATFFPDAEALGDDVELPMSCTMWDFFHRVDIAASRTVKRHPLATELFDVAGACDRLFGIDEGRMLFRGVRATLREACPLHEVSHHGERALRAPGGTRKVVYVSGIPGHLSANYRTLISSMHARLRWRQEGHGVQPLASLVGIGKRLTEPSFVFWMLIFQHIMEHIVAPVGLAVQSAKEPWVICDGLDHAMQAIAVCQEKSADLLNFLSVIALLRQTLTRKDIRNFLIAQRYSTLGRYFHSLWPHLVGLLCNVPPMFKGVHLSSIDIDGRVLGPSCQCACVENALAYGARVGPGFKYNVPLGFPPPGGLPLPGGLSPRRVRVPVWVAFAAKEQALEVGEPRWQRRRPDQLAPGRFVLHNMFRQKFTANQTSRCCVLKGVYEVHKTLCGVLQRGQQFMEFLHEELTSVFGSVGTNPKMLELLRNVAVAWNWKHLVINSPEVKHIIAFTKVARLLRHFLVHSMMPDPNIFGAQAPWSAVTEDELKVQYVLLLRRVRNAFASGKFQEFVGPTTFEVMPVWSFTFIVRFFHHVLRLPAATRHNRSICCRIGAVLSMFLGSWQGCPLPLEATHTFTIPITEVQAVGASIGRRVRVRTKVNLVKQITVGQVLAVRAANSCTKAHLVTVCAVNQQLDSTAVSARLDADPYFACGEPGAGHASAWHAVRLHHRCRMLYAPEAACERLGSYMHYQFRQWKGGHVTPSVLIGRVFLEQAHVRCVGSTRDELLIAEVVHILRHTFKQKAYYRNNNSQHSLEQIEATLASMKTSGRELEDWSIFESGFLRPAEYEMRMLSSTGRLLHKERQREASLSVLPNSLSNVVRSVVRATGVIDALPETVEMTGKRLRRSTDSVIRDHLSAWWATPDGKEWAKTRESMLSEYG